MNRRILGLSLLVMLATLTLLPPLFGFQPTPILMGAVDPVTPGPNDLNATTPLINYEEYTPANPDGNSTLLDVLVVLVNASDIGECKDGDLTIHTFGVYFDNNNSLVFEDDLEYVSGWGWTIENYSLFQWNLNASPYKVRCFFERNTGVEIWNTTTAWSTMFLYSHRLTIGRPDFTYIGDTSDTIDVIVEHISSTAWGTLTDANTTLVFRQESNHTNLLQFSDVLVYNVSSTYWELNELNISALISGEAYGIQVYANYSLRRPFQIGFSSWSELFTFKGPYLRIANPLTFYVGHDVQILNITVSWVWHSVFGYLTNMDVDVANYSIYLSSGSGALANGTLSWNSTGSNWYLSKLNISYYIEQGTFTIGESYNTTVFFNAVSQSGRPSVNATSPFSAPFILDRDPPVVEQTFLNPETPTDTDFTVITAEISDDALIDVVILSYSNGTHWMNITMRGAHNKLANFTAAIPIFHERFEVQYRIYVNDTQDAWGNSTIFSYIVADTPPVIAYVIFLPTNPLDVNPVTVNATVTDGTAVGIVNLYYSYNGVSWSPAVEMVNIAEAIYQAVIPPHPLMPNYQFDSVHFRIEASDTYDNLRTSTTYAYLVQGSLFAIDPVTGLLAMSILGLTVVTLIVLYKVYERY